MSTEVTRLFLDLLWKLQTEAGMTNQELARRTGVTPSYISHLKSPRREGRRLGLEFALSAARQFPALGVFLIHELTTISDERTKVSGTAQSSTDESE